MNIILLGFMGAGKTTVGKKLSLRLGYRFVDTDQMIVEQQGREIEDIFQKEGEPFFRSLETKTIGELAKAQNSVISTGGGMITTPGNLEKLKQIGPTVFLDCDFEIILERVLRNDKRPLAKTQNPEETLRNLYQIRRPLYLQADIVVETGHQKINQVINQIIRAL